ncbi:hypothetical protein F383_09404 [Gossypium arboreum]|uniref:Uncharacterized protein n=1 Tax=Gossypium arboreum TaxID=29729 RepID=A0A0B0NVG0_GOSAR|nr:hypothetical protein F383_09404 [Gossypium arboreum]
MGFLVTTLIFAVIGIIASLCTRICCNRGPSANLVSVDWYTSMKCALMCKLCLKALCHNKNALILFGHELMFRSGAQWAPPNTGHYSNGLLLDDVGNCISCTNETTHCPHFE